MPNKLTMKCKQCKDLHIKDILMILKDSMIVGTALSKFLDDYRILKDTFSNFYLICIDNTPFHIINK